MSSDSRPLDPYTTPASADHMRQTARGYSEWQCFWRLALLGVVAVVIGGPLLYLLSEMRTDAWVQMLTPGVLVGIMLWLGTHWYIGSVSTIGKIVVVLGSLLAWGTTGVVYEMTLPSGWFSEQPWTWDLLKPYVCSAPAGAAVLILSMTLGGGYAPRRVLITVFLFCSLFGGGTFFIIDELGWRQDKFNVDLLGLVCSSVYQIALLALLGWLLAAASAEKQIAEQLRQELAAS